MKQALVLTVGTGTRPDTNIVRPLIKTVKNSHPDFLAFIVSDVSRGFAEEIARQLALAKHFILELRFEPALRILEGMNGHLLDEYQFKLLDNLKNTALAYHSWEIFD